MTKENIETIKAILEKEETINKDTNNSTKDFLRGINKGIAHAYQFILDNYDIFTEKSDDYNKKYLEEEINKHMELARTYL